METSSEAADRPRRLDVQIDGTTGRLIGRVDFADRHCWTESSAMASPRLKALFGIANQLLGTATALLLVVLAASGAIIWWRRSSLWLSTG